MLKHRFDASGNFASQTQGDLSRPQILGQPVDQVSTLGQSARFSVEVADASGLTYQWQIDGGEIHRRHGRQPLADEQ